MTFKRARDEDEYEVSTCLMLLSKVGNSDHQEPSTENSSDSDISSVTAAATSGQRVYECKTCGKRFDSFQALGGHRASHKKIRLVAELLTAPAKAKRHECPLCGLEFPLGQALGGHMRRHRAELEEKRDHDHDHDHKTAPLPKVVSMKRSNSGKRVFGLDLDLNLTPYENDLKLGGKMQSSHVSPLFSAFFYLNSTA